MKHTILEFVGGAWDGMNLSTLSPDPTEVALAAYTLKVTHYGSKDQAVVMPREYALGTGGCQYVATHHISVGGESLVRLECVEGDCAEASDRPLKTIVLQFVSGCLDGRTIRSDAANVHEALIATSYYCLTDHGAVSAILKILPCLCGQVQGGLCRGNGIVEYRVVERDEKEGAITVILEYLERQS
jgi:hypothetical protein